MLRTHLTFANIAAGTALALVLGAGSAAVGSAQIKNGAVKSKDIKDDAITGVDVSESTLGEVPVATSVRTVQTVRATAAAGQASILAQRSGMVLTLTCTDAGSGKIDAELGLASTVPDVKASVSDGADFHFDLDPGDAPLLVIQALGSSEGIRDGCFAALTGAGASWQGSGFVVNHYQGGTGCLAEMTFVG